MISLHFKHIAPRNYFNYEKFYKGPPELDLKFNYCKSYFLAGKITNRNILLKNRRAHVFTKQLRLIAGIIILLPAVLCADVELVLDGRYAFKTTGAATKAVSFLGYIDPTAVWRLRNYTVDATARDHGTETLIFATDPDAFGLSTVQSAFASKLAGDVLAKKVMITKTN